MAKIKLNERTLTIESKFTRAALVEIYREEPDVLNLKDEDGDAYFYVGVTGTTGVSSGSGGIFKSGICFDADSLNSGLAQATITIAGETTDEVRDNAFKTAGEAFDRLVRVEQEIDAYLTTREAKKTMFFNALQ